MPGAPQHTASDFDVVCSGRTLRVRRLGLAGCEGGPTLVFLHEGLGSISQWRDFPLALAEAVGLPALIYDRFGYGASQAREGPVAPGFLEREAESDLPGVLAACGVSRPILVGHSDGGTIALLFAALFPERPVAVIAEAAHVFVDPVTVAGLVQARRAFATTALRAKLMRHHGPKVDSMFRGWNDVWLSPDHRVWDVTGRLGAVTAPVLAIQGEDDEYGSRAQVDAILQGVGGPAQGFMVPACGHVPHLQARASVLEAMARFVKSWAGRPGLKPPGPP